jgi:hypothetical protein
MGMLIGAVFGVLIGLAVAATTVVGVVQTVKEDPASTPTNQPPVVEYGKR